MYLKRIIVFFCLAMCLASLAMAQSDWVDDAGIEDAKLVVEKQKVITLPKATRTFAKMPRLEKVEEKQEQKYSLELSSLQLSDIEPQFKLVAYKSQTLERLYGNFVKAGFGNYLTPYLEGHVGAKRSEKYTYGLSAKHLSSANGPVDKNFSGESLSRLEGYGKLFGKGFDVAASAGYERRGLRYYGYEQAPAELDSIRQVYHVFYAKGEFIKPEQAKTPFSYTAGIDGYHFSDRYQATEWQAALKFQGALALSNGRLQFEAMPIINFFQQADTLKRNRSLVKAGVAYSMKTDNMQLRIGAGAAYQMDSSSALGAIAVYPDIAFQYEVMPNKVSVYARAKGDLHQQQMRVLTAENPFLATNQAPDFTYEIGRASAGVKAAIASKVGFGIEAGYSLRKNMPFYMNKASDSSYFLLAYDSGMVGTFDAKGTLQFIFDRIQASWSIGFYSYSPENLTAAYHLPSIENRVSVKYSQDKICIGAEFVQLSGMMASIGGRNEQLKSIFDLSLRGEYEVKERLRVFLDARNLAAQQYQRYYRYPSKGVNVLLGASYMF